MLTKRFLLVLLSALSLFASACTEQHPFRKDDSIHKQLAQERAKHQDAISKMQAEIDALRSAAAERDALRVKKESLEARLRDVEGRIGTLKEAEAEAERTREKAERLKLERDEINERFAKYAKLENIAVDVTSLGVRITVGDSLLFPSASSRLNDGAKDFLATLSEVLKKSDPLEIRIVGHTDAQPLKNSPQFRSNWELSSARAQSVLYALVENHGLPDEKFVVAGRGSHDPVAPNDSPENRARNRRVEVFLIPRN